MALSLSIYIYIYISLSLSIYIYIYIYIYTCIYILVCVCVLKGHYTSVSYIRETIYNLITRHVLHARGGYLIEDGRADVEGTG